MTDLQFTPHGERPSLSPRTHALLVLGFLAFVIYGSLVPFHWHALPLRTALARWHEVCARPITFDSLSDWVTNVVLFVPVGYLAMAACCVDRPRVLGLAAAPVVLVLCIAFSFSVEFTQLFFPPRCSSLNDVTANTLGSAAGISTWLAVGQHLTGWLRRTWVLLGQRGLSTRLLPAYLLFLFLVNAMPLDLTIRPADLYHKYKEGRVHLVPFAADLHNPERFLRGTIWTTILFLPVGVLLARSRGPGWRTPHAWRRTLALGLAVAGLVEFMQLFVYSRYCKSGDVIVGTLAIFAGWRAGRAWQHGTASQVPWRWRPVSGLPDLRWVLLMVWLTILAFMNWQPFDFIADPSVVMRRLQEMSLVPFVDYQATSPQHALEQCLNKAVMFLPLGALLAWALGAANRTRPSVLVVCTGAFIALGLEVGQLFLQSRYASVTDVLIETGGVWIGCQLVRQLGDRSLAAKPGGASGHPC